MSELLQTFTPYKRRGYRRVKIKTHVFHDPKLARLALIAHLLDAEMASPVYTAGPPAGTATFTPATAATQTAVAISSTATDFGLQLVAYRIGYGKSAAAAGSPIHAYSYNAATLGTSTAATITQQSGRTIASTNIIGGYNYTVEPTTKVYVDSAGQLQPFGGDLVYDYPTATAPDYFNSGAMGFGVEHVPPDTSTPTTVSMSFSRC